MKQLRKRLKSKNNFIAIQTVKGVPNKWNALLLHMYNGSYSNIFCNFA